MRPPRVLLIQRAIWKDAYNLEEEPQEPGEENRYNAPCSIQRFHGRHRASIQTVSSSGCMGASGKEIDGLSQAVVCQRSEGCTLVPHAVITAFSTICNSCEILLERLNVAVSLEEKRPLKSHAPQHG